MSIKLGTHFINLNTYQVVHCLEILMKQEKSNLTIYETNGFVQQLITFYTFLQTK